MTDRAGATPPPGQSGRSAPAGADWARPRAVVDAALAAFLDGKRAMLAGMDAGLLPVADELAGRCADRPRLRPAFAYWAWRGLAAEGGAERREDESAVLRALSALELLDIGAQVHREAMSGPVSPAGRPTTDRTFAHRHRDDGLDGDGAAFGTGAAILVGDLALVWSDELLNAAGLSRHALARVGPVWDAMRTGSTASRYLDLFRAAGGAVAHPGPASGPVQQALQVGAALAGAGRRAVQGCALVGVALDEARRAPDRPELTARARAALTAAPLAEEARTALAALAVAAVPVGV